ncbi:MAG: SpoVA/SpoVAEb family sporulation membrane protein [Clostridia bacterium]|nr:SpoVA/SpoVAEb family sporulation membrane protein [Clostridia bacterium]
MNYLISFLIGGLLCIPAQILLDKTKLTNARILTLYVVVGVILGGIGVYKPIADFASTGATIPLTGFGYTLSKGVKEAVESEGFIGIIKGGLIATSTGISFTLFVALLTSLFCKSHTK